MRLSGWEHLRFRKTNMLLLWADWATWLTELRAGSISGVLPGSTSMYSLVHGRTRTQRPLCLFSLHYKVNVRIWKKFPIMKSLCCARVRNDHPLPHLTCTLWLQGEIPSYSDAEVSAECSTYILEGVFLYMYYCIVSNYKMIYSFTILQHRHSALPPPVSTFS